MTQRSGDQMIDSITANSAWVDALLNLFFAVDEAHKNEDDLPLSVREAYDQAEAARARL